MDANVTNTAIIPGDSAIPVIAGVSVLPVIAGVSMMPVKPGDSAVPAITGREKRSTSRSSESIRFIGFSPGRK
jgi:hypothetical protein